MSEIAPAKFLSLDSSLLANLSRDYYSGNATSRHHAREFVSLSLSAGWTPLICWHQLEELIRHPDEEIAAQRVRFIRALPALAWISTASVPHDVGSICDILVCEVAVVVENRSAKLLEVREAVKQRLLCFGTGSEALKDWGDSWYALRSRLQEREARLREISSISQAQSLRSVESKSIRIFLGGEIRPVREAHARLDDLRATLAEELQRRGDPRMSNAADVAAEFMDEVLAEAAPLRDGGADPIAAYLAMHGIDRAELNPQWTMRDLFELTHFRSQLRIAEENLRVPQGSLAPIVSQESIPSWIVQRAIRRHRSTPAKTEGGDLTDLYLLCLALYADLTVVDKRTWENCRRARGKEPAAFELLNDVVKVSDYRALLSRLTS